jgi:hypothetical protein
MQQEQNYFGFPSWGGGRKFTSIVFGGNKLKWDINMYYSLIFVLAPISDNFPEIDYHLLLCNAYPPIANL